MNADGKQNGIWKAWDEDGTLASEGTYIKGIKEGAWSESYIKSGVRHTVKCTYKNGLRERSYQSFWPGGRKYEERVYVKGHEDGPAADWDENGLITFKGAFRYNGFSAVGDGLCSLYYYSPQNKLVKREDRTYENGAAGACVTHYFENSVETRVERQNP